MPCEQNPTIMSLGNSKPAHDQVMQRKTLGQPQPANNIFRSDNQILIYNNYFFAVLESGGYDKTLHEGSHEKQ